MRYAANLSFYCQTTAYQNLLYDVAVIPLITSSHTNHMTTRAITLARVRNIGDSALPTMRFRIEMMFILKATK